MQAQLRMICWLFMKLTCPNLEKIDVKQQNIIGIAHIMVLYQYIQRIINTKQQSHLNRYEKRLI